MPTQIAVSKNSVNAYFDLYEQKIYQTKSTWAATNNGMVTPAEF